MIDLAQFAVVCTFGALHALVVLPVILSFVGPEPYVVRIDDADDDGHDWVDNPITPDAGTGWTSCSGELVVGLA